MLVSQKWPQKMAASWGIFCTERLNFVMLVLYQH